MKKFISISLLFFNLLFGAESDSLANNVYVGDFNINETCKPVCRALNTEFKAIVTDFNPYNGITKCKIIRPGFFETTQSDYVADTYNQQCVTSTNNKVDVGSLTSYGKSFNSNPTLTYENKASLSKY